MICEKNYDSLDNDAKIQYWQNKFNQERIKCIALEHKLKVALEKENE